jgi:hypothetical protein
MPSGSLCSGVCFTKVCFTKISGLSVGERVRSLLEVLVPHPENCVATQESSRGGGPAQHGGDKRSNGVAKQSGVVSQASSKVMASTQVGNRKV